MDRQIVYVGAIPLDTDQLLQSRNTMVALGYLAKMTVGDGGSYADGFPCTPAGGLAVLIGAGSLTYPTMVDSGYYGALPPDGDPLLKIGVNSGSTVVPLPGTGEIVISAAFAETASGTAAMAYYNAANPNQTLIGPQGNGEAQATVVQQRVVFTATALLDIPEGNTPLWQVSVPAGAVSLTAAMISQAAGAPFVPVKLPQAAPIFSPSFTGNPTAPTVLAGDASTCLATTGFVALATMRNRAAWGSGGTYSWTCPGGVSAVLIRAWGSGGTGGSANGSFPGGGGGGGHIEVLVSVVAGTSYAITIGKGAGGPSASRFDGRVVVSGGGNGQSGQSSQCGAGGTAGTPSTNTINSVASIGVGPGQGGYQSGSVNVGGAGGCSFGIQGAPVCFGGTTGTAGVWPGGGGSGGANGSGGTGADGLLIIEWNG